MKKLMIILFVLVFAESLYGSYDATLDTPVEYDTLMLYSSQSILVTDTGYVEYNGGVIFDNCTMDVEGAVEFNSDPNLINTVIRVFGVLEAQPGINIYETGTSSIIATGDHLRKGIVLIEGRLNNWISIFSDHVVPDAEFLIFDPNSSAESSVHCVDFFGGWTNIWTRNKRFDNGITNCRFIGAQYGVWQDGIHDLTDVKFSFFTGNQTSIYLGMDGAYGVSEGCVVDNVTFDNQYGSPSYCIVVNGQVSVPDLRSLRITNSILTRAYCGWFINNSSFYPPIVSNLAYYDNSFNDNLMDSSFQQNPMPLVETPFDDSGNWPYFIDPNSPVAYADLGYNLFQNEPPQLLTSIYRNPMPRTNTGIGFGAPLPDNYSSSVFPVQADLDRSGRVGLPDFGIFAQDWGTERGFDLINHPDPNGYSIADFNKDGFVDTNDLQNFSFEWLENGAASLNVIDDVNFLTAMCEELDGIETKEYAFFINGKYFATKDPCYHPELTVDKVFLDKGPQDLKAVIKDREGHLYVTKGFPFSVDTPLSSFSFKETFDPDKRLPISGKVDPGYTASVSILSEDDELMWSADFTGDFFTMVDPDSVNWEDVSYKLEYSCSPTPAKSLGFPLSKAGASGTYSGLAFILALDGPPVNKTASLLVSMLTDGMTRGTSYNDTGNVRYAEEKTKGEGIVTILLRGFGTHNQVRLPIFKKVFKKYTKICYSHFYCHANYECDGPGLLGLNKRRAVMLFNDGKWPAYNSREWTDFGNPVPSHYVWLSDDLEKANHLYMLPFDYDEVSIAVFMSCLIMQNVATVDSYGICDYQEDIYEYEIDHNLHAHWEYFYTDVTSAWNIWEDHQVALGSGGYVIEGALCHSWRIFFNKFYEGLSNNKTAADAFLEDAYPVMTTQVDRHFRYRGIGMQNAMLKKNPPTKSAKSNVTPMIFTSKGPIDMSHRKNSTRYLGGSRFPAKLFSTVKHDSVGYIEDRNQVRTKEIFAVNQNKEN